MTIMQAGSPNGIMNHRSSGARGITNLPLASVVVQASHSPLITTDAGEIGCFVFLSSTMPVSGCVPSECGKKQPHTIAASASAAAWRSVMCRSYHWPRQQTTCGHHRWTPPCPRRGLRERCSAWQPAPASSVEFRVCGDALSGVAPLPQRSFGSLRPLLGQGEVT